MLRTLSVAAAVRCPLRLSRPCPLPGPLLLGLLSRQVREAAGSAGAECGSVLKTPKVRAVRCGTGWHCAVRRGALRRGLSRRSASTLRPAQGTRDHHPAQMALRERLFGTVVACFKRHGAAAIDTPVLELRVRTWSPGSGCTLRCGVSPGVPWWECCALLSNALLSGHLTLFRFPVLCTRGWGSPGGWGGRAALTGHHSGFSLKNERPASVMAHS